MNTTAPTPVTANLLAAHGISKEIIDAGQKLGFSWAAILALAIKYGPALLEILQSLLAAKEKHPA